MTAQEAQLMLTTCATRVSNSVFTEIEKPGNPEFFQNRKTGFLAACKPGFSVLNFDLQMSSRFRATLLVVLQHVAHLSRWQ